MLELFEEAKKVQQNSYSPYSNFKVGAALLTENGYIYKGCNVENIAFSPSCCAERVAFYKAISEGEKNFKKIAIVGNDINEPCFPCGVCRQIMVEFCDEDFEIIVNSKKGLKSYKLKELMPYAFDKLDKEVK